MPVDFREKKKKQKYLGLIALGVIIVAFAIFYFGYLNNEPGTGATIPEGAVQPPPPIVINYSVLENPIIDQLEPYLVVPEYEGELGKENPFLP